MDIDLLRRRAVEAFRNTAAFGDRDTPERRSAFAELSRLAEQIAGLLPPHDEQGALARRGAISAAVAAQEGARARDLAERFAGEAGVGDATAAELRVLAAAPQPAPTTLAEAEARAREVVKAWEWAALACGRAIGATQGPDPADLTMLSDVAALFRVTGVTPAEVLAAIPRPAGAPAYALAGLAPLLGPLGGLAAVAGIGGTGDPLYAQTVGTALIAFMRERSPLA